MRQALPLQRVNKKSAVRTLPSANPTIRRRHVPAHDFSVFQTYV
jgi:hypothetical protein